MTADFWMGIAIGSLGAWAFLIVVLVAMQTGKGKAKTGNSIASDMLRERNQIGREQAKHLRAIATWLEVTVREGRRGL
jgi:hypothetical protein